MYKNAVLIALFFIVLTAITGCSSKFSNTLRGQEFNPSAYSIPTFADLEVASKKVMGKAKGSVADKERLEKHAIGNALKQTNSPFDADVLVGANFFYETKNSVLEVIVIGYPARYKNFRPVNKSDAIVFNSMSPVKDTAKITIEEEVIIKSDSIESKTEENITVTGGEK